MNNQVSTVTVLHYLIKLCFICSVALGKYLYFAVLSLCTSTTSISQLRSHACNYLTQMRGFPFLFSVVEKYSIMR